MASKVLVKCITSPSRCASLLETSRGRPLLALEIQRHRIGMAVVYSPLGDDVEALPDIRLTASSSAKKTPSSSSSSVRSLSLTTTTSRRIPREALDKLATTIRNNDVCGLIVAWPIQRDTGKMGGPCGRVLFTLESMMSEDYGCSMLSPRRPLCLWTPSISSTLSNGDKTATYDSPPEEDSWGRCSAYGMPSEKTIHFASREQFAFDESRQATDLWYDFWKTHWPDLYRRREQARRRRQASSYGNNNLVADWRDSPAYLPAEVAL